MQTKLYLKFYGFSDKTHTLRDFTINLSCHATTPPKKSCKHGFKAFEKSRLLAMEQLR